MITHSYQINDKNRSYNSLIQSYSSIMLSSLCTFVGISLLQKNSITMNEIYQQKPRHFYLVIIYYILYIYQLYNFLNLLYVYMI